MAAIDNVVPKLMQVDQRPAGVLLCPRPSELESGHCHPCGRRAHHGSALPSGAQRHEAAKPFAVSRLRGFSLLDGRPRSRISSNLNSEDKGFSPRTNIGSLIRSESRVACRRPRPPILAITPNRDISRRPSLLWRAHSVLSKDVENYEEMLGRAIAFAVDEPLARKRRSTVQTISAWFPLPNR